jgi:hypothetical protein
LEGKAAATGRRFQASGKGPCPKEAHFQESHLTRRKMWLRYCLVPLTRPIDKVGRRRTSLTQAIGRSYGVNSPLGGAWVPLVAEAFLDNSSVKALLKQIRGFVAVADNRLDPCDQGGAIWALGSCKSDD